MKEILLKLSVCLYFIPMFIIGSILSVVSFPILIGIIGAKDIMDWYEKKFKETRW